jgi:hypothetical protein
MLIVCTQDQIIRDTAADRDSGSPEWGYLTALNLGGQPGATVQFEAELRRLKVAEPLALSAHGNDEEIGDEGRRGWVWSPGDVAAMLDRNAPAQWLGPVLIHACAETIVNFSARLAGALSGSRFRGMWCFGYNRPLASAAGFPPPASMTKRVDLQWTRVD